MFYNELDNRNKAWIFTLRDRVRLVGQVVNVMRDLYGHILMIEIREGAATKTTNIPIEAIIYIQEL